MYNLRDTNSITLVTLLVSLLKHTLSNLVLKGLKNVS